MFIWATANILSLSAISCPIAGRTELNIEVSASHTSFARDSSFSKVITLLCSVPTT